MNLRGEGRRISVEEPARTPETSLFFGYGAMIPLVAGALYVWVASDAQAFLAVNVALFWGAAILIFLAGVRRGVSFRTPGGPKLSQLLMMLWLFFGGFISLIATIWAFPMIAVAILLLGYVSLALIDPMAAKRGDAPLFFERLRPVQMILPIVSLVILGAYVWRSPFL